MNIYSRLATFAGGLSLFAALVTIPLIAAAVAPGLS
jgi:hypothetical protein